MLTFASDMLLHSELEYPVRKPVSGRLLFKLRKVLGKILLDPTRATHTQDPNGSDGLQSARPQHSNLEQTDADGFQKTGQGVVPPDLCFVPATGL